MSANDLMRLLAYIWLAITLIGIAWFITHPAWMRKISPPPSTEKCPLCGKTYTEKKANPYGGMEYIHVKTETFTASCQQSSESYRKYIGSHD